ncbi:protein canopy homolog 4 isoform X2 [Monodelphis domestica]|uniref:protein canopy homolog 4 isoform X2 n=1 Tax=Monodelphis domestica TaxID=13616 RepID=UPI000443241C|nr:protein canopy homolog 4 isoform X2 [Monodelphis domestica]
MGQRWRRRQQELLLFCYFMLMLRSCAGTQKEVEKENEEERLPSKCEVCKILSLELQGELNRSSQSRELLELGQVLDTGKRKRRVPYNTSEIRLEEALEKLCERILDYSVHAEHKGSLRYAKCEMMLERFEDVVEDWYFHHQELPLQQFLCEGHVLGKEEAGCLQETWTEESRGEQNEKGLEESLGQHPHDTADL